MWKTRRKGRKAFTLVEILVSMVILGLVMGAVLGLFFAIVTHLEQSNDITTAQQRGEMVLTALGPKILAAGLGMPQGVSFDHQFELLESTWTSAVMLNGDDELTIVYAVPTEAVVSGETSLTANTAASVDVIDDNTLPSVSELKKKQEETVGWVVFPATSVALEVNDGTPQSSPLEILPKAGGKVYANDHLHLVRATLAKVENNWFVMNGLKPDTPKKVVEGIADVRFERVGDTLTVWVLARGNTRHDKEITPAALPDWPNAFEPIDTENRHYRLKAVQRTWRLRNE